MSEKKIKSGDLVMHRTKTGPTMVVRGKGTNGGWKCSYWVDTKNDFVFTEFFDTEIIVIKEYQG